MTAADRDVAITIVGKASPLENRIVCLDREHLHLFAEVIDTILQTSSSTNEINSRYWLRPLAIAASDPDSFNLELRHDLREAAQLILPIALFRDALDTEVLPLIGELLHAPTDADRSHSARQALHDFIAAIYRSSK